jgi:O-antigen/teichoic acid export membrane protein
MLGQMGQALVQGLQFLLVARMLGPHEFGYVAGVLAVTSALLPFSGLGSANMMVMHLARGTGVAHMLYGNSLTAGTVVGSALTLLSAAVCYAITRDPSMSGLFLIFGASELVCTKLVDISQHVFYGLEKHVIASRFMLLQGGFRLAGAAIMAATIQHPVAHDWAWAHLIGGVLPMVGVLLYTRRETGYLSFDFKRLMSDLRTGVFFSLGLSARGVYTDVDKAVLGHVISPSVNGAYTAAFRLVFMATTPLTAGLLALQARMFRAGHDEGGIHRTTRIARTAIMAGVGYGLVVGVALYLCAPFLPLVLGAKYEQSVVILQALAFLPIPLFIQNALSDALAAANFQRLRSFVQMTVAGLSLVLNLVLTSKLSWTGAVIASYTCQIVLAMLMAYMVARKLSLSAR